MRICSRTPCDVQSSMTILDTAPDALHSLRSAWRDGQLVVVTLCAAWCHTCDEFRVALQRIAQSRPDAAFLWLDIEDDAAICGDVDVENFPTLAVFRGDALLHFGVSLPHEGIVARLIDELARRTDGVSDAHEEVLAMRALLRGD